MAGCSDFAAACRQHPNGTENGHQEILLSLHMVPLQALQVESFRMKHLRLDPSRTEPAGEQLEVMLQLLQLQLPGACSFPVTKPAMSAFASGYPVIVCHLKFELCLPSS